jgi:DNA-directed RNA polymerase specialized sigma24 family protein
VLPGGEAVTYTARDDLLDSYRAARHADEMAREDRDLGYDTERAMHKAEGIRQPVTLRDFLRDAQPLAPTPDEHARVMGDYLSVSASDVAIAGLAYEQATQALDLACLDAQECGWSLRRIAQSLGCSHQAVENRIARARGRA